MSFLFSNRPVQGVRLHTSDLVRLLFIAAITVAMAQPVSVSGQERFDLFSRSWKLPNPAAEPQDAAAKLRGSVVYIAPNLNISDLGRPNSSIRRIGLVNSIAFYDEARGIDRLVRLDAMVRREVDPLAKRSAELFEELKKRQADLAMHRSPLFCPGRELFEKSLAEIRKLAENLRRESMYARGLYERRETEATATTRTEIYSALNKFAIESGFDLLLDTAVLPDAVLYYQPSIDITDTFAAGFNSGKHHPVQATQAKLLFVDTSVFYDEQNGIGRLVRALSSTEAAKRTDETDYTHNQRIERIRQPVWDDIIKHLDDFAARREATLILDSGKLGISGSKLDATAAFIAEYNDRTAGT